MRGTFSAWGESLNDTVVPLAHHPRNSPFPVPPTAPCVYLSRIRVHYDVDILGVRGDVSRRVTKGELFPSVNPPNVQSFIRTPSTASTPTLVHLSPPCDDSHYSTSPSEVLLTAKAGQAGNIPAILKRIIMHAALKAVVRRWWCSSDGTQELPARGHLSNLRIYDLGV